MEIVDEKAKVDKREELKEKIRLFKKNEEAVYDILALYQFLITNGDMNSLIGVILAEKVLADLKDIEVEVSYKANSIQDFYAKIDSDYKSLPQP